MVTNENEEILNGSFSSMIQPIWKNFLKKLR